MLNRPSFAELIFQPVEDEVVTLVVNPYRKMTRRKRMRLYRKMKREEKRYVAIRRW